MVGQLRGEGRRDHARRSSPQQLAIAARALAARGARRGLRGQTLRARSDHHAGAACAAQRASPRQVARHHRRRRHPRRVRAIVEYLTDRYGAGRLVPAAGTPERLRYTYWLHYAEGSAMPPLLLKLVFSRIETAPMPFVVRPIARAIARRARTSFIEPQIALHLDFMERALDEHVWFAGSDFTAADIQMSFPLEAAAARGGLDASRPRLKAFLDRIHARPAYQRALERGGPYELLQ